MVSHPPRPVHRPEGQRGPRGLAFWARFAVAAWILACALSAAPARRQVSIALVLWRGPTPAETSFMDALRKSPGLDPRFSIFDAQVSPERLRSQIALLKGRRFDLIYAFGTSVAKALQAEVKDTPIVFNIVARPVANGLIRDWTHSGNNLTGVSNAVPMASAFRALHILMHIRRLGFVYSPAEPNSLAQLEEVRAQEAHFGFRLVPVPLNPGQPIPLTLHRLLGENVDAVLLPSDSQVLVHGAEILAYLNRNGMPTIATVPDLVKEQGTLVGLGPDYRALGLLAAQSAREVLEGRAPTDIPSRTSDQLDLVLNLRTAKRLGISVPIQLVKVATLVL